MGTILMEDTLQLLKRLLDEGKISNQAYKTYVGQVKHGDEKACLLGLKRKHLI